MMNTLLTAFLQAGPPIDMADNFRADGKIYVVVAIIAIIFIGISAYLIHLDRKISRIEAGVTKPSQNQAS